MFERRSGAFTERLSLIMVIVSALGAFFVLIDPKITISEGWQFGGEGFSSDLKGAVVSLILIGGWSAVKEYWLGSSNESSKKTDIINDIITKEKP